MEKVKVTKEQAEALGRVQHKENFIKGYIRGGYHHEDNNVLLEIPFDDFIKSLYIGYEVELTPEEKIKEQFEKFRTEETTDSMDVMWNKGFLQGVRSTLENLGIEIEGVNK